MLEELGPLVVGIEEDLFAVELFTVEKGVDLRFLSQADVVKHRHTVVLNILDDRLDLEI